MLGALRDFLGKRRQELLEAMVNNMDHSEHLLLVGKFRAVNEIIKKLAEFERNMHMEE